MPNARPTVEVVLCAYNGARYVEEQLRSIVLQTTPVDLISIYDDCSSDDTVATIEALANGRRGVGPPIRVTRNARNLGYAQNFGQALGAATGDYVAFSDQDDVWEPTKVASLLQLFAVPGCRLAFSDGLVIDGAGAIDDGPTVLRRYGLDAAGIRRFGESGWSLLLRRNFINGAAMMVDRETAQAALPIPAGFPHDYWLALWMAADRAIACTETPLYRYRLHDSNVIGAATGRLHHQLLSIWRDPGPPRAQELRRTRSLLARLPDDDPRRVDVACKLAWLASVCEDPRPGRRLSRIARTWWHGDYARFSGPYALLRDLVATVRGR